MQNLEEMADLTVEVIKPVEHAGFGFSFFLFIPILFIILISAYGAIAKKNQFVIDLAHNLRVMRIEQISMVGTMIGGSYWILSWVMDQLEGKEDAKWLLVAIPLFFAKLIVSGREIFAKVEKDESKS